MGKNIFEKVKFSFRLVAFNILLLMIFLLTAELLLRLIQPNYIIYTRTYPHQFRDCTFDGKHFKVSWPKKDSIAGWVCNSEHFMTFSNKELNVRKIFYQINKQGYRSRYNYDSINCINKTKCRILLLGDSFIFGTYLKENETIANELEKKLGDKYDFINLGIPGYGIDQMLLSYEFWNSKIMPDLVVLFYVDDDIVRVLESYRRTEGINKPAFDLENDKLVIKREYKAGILDKIFENSFFANKFYRRYSENKAVEISKMLLNKLIKLTEHNKQKLLIIRCPVKENFTNDKLERFSLHDKMINPKVYFEMRNEFSKVPLSKVYQYYLKNDSHLSPAGTKLAAEYIMKLINNKDK